MPDGAEVPLDISGHEDRTPPGERDGEDADREAPGTDGDGPAASTDAGPAVAAETDAAGEPAANGEPTGGADGPGDDDEVEPVELLVNLAEDGEIDPWDIDIVAVTDKFLARLDEADLRTSGRALFYASVLLRMKSDALVDEADEAEEEDDLAPWEAPRDDGQKGPLPDPVAGLEREMERRLERKSARGTPETLDELVRELREAERDTWWKEKREYDTSESPSGFRRGTQTLDYRTGDDVRVDEEPTEGDVTRTAHTEDIEAVIRDVRRALNEHYDAGRDEVLYAEVAQSGGSRVETYLALLFLAHRGHVRLLQDQLFGDLWIRDPTAAGGSTEAVAD